MSRQMHGFARSILKLAEPLTLERFTGTESSGGYHSDTYADPVEIKGVLRPGDIDVPFVGTGGQQGTYDWYLITAEEYDVGEDDLIRRQQGFASASSGNRYEVSMPRECPVHDVAVYQLDEIDER